MQHTRASTAPIDSMHTSVASTGVKRRRYRRQSDSASSGKLDDDKDDDKDDAASAPSELAKRKRKASVFTFSKKIHPSDSEAACTFARPLRNLKLQGAGHIDRILQPLIKARERHAGEAEASGGAGRADSGGSGCTRVARAAPARGSSDTRTPVGVLSVEPEVNTKLMLSVPPDTMAPLLPLEAKAKDGKDGKGGKDGKDRLGPLYCQCGLLGRATEAIASKPHHGIAVEEVAPVAVTIAAAAAGSSSTAAAAAAHIEKLKAAILKAAVKDVEFGCQLLVLPEGADGKPISWPGLESSVLFVRPEFKRLFEDVLDAFSPAKMLPGRRHSLLRGVPGMGTSSFGMYALWRLATAGRSVLFEYAKGLPRGTCLSFGLPGTPDVNIADGCTPFWPVSASGPARLVISSPNGGGGEGRPFYHGFAKDAVSIYLREPAPAELLTMGKHCFGLRDDDVAGQAAARDRLRRNGPNPRHVFGRTAVEAARLEGAIQRQRITALCDFAQSTDEAVAARDIGFHVLHYDVSADCRSVSYRWASPYVGERVAEVLQSADVKDRRSLLSALLRNEALRSMRGSLMDKWRHIDVGVGVGVDVKSAPKL